MARFWDPDLGAVQMAGLKFGTAANHYGSIDQTHRAAWFYCVAPNKWISALVGAVST